MRSIAMAILLTLTTSVTMYAGNKALGDLETFNWETYNVSFDIPDYMEVKTNTGSLFYAAGRDMFINIYPEKTSTSGSTLCDEHYAELRLTDKEIVSEPSSYSNSGLNGAYLIGTGYNGSQKYAYIVAGFNDSERENGFKVDIQILTTAPDYSEIIEDAVDMLNSFKSISGKSGTSSSGSTTTKRDGTVQWSDYNFEFDYPTELDINRDRDGYFDADDGTLYLTVRQQNGSKSPRRVANSVFKDLRIEDPEDTANDVFDQGGLDGWKVIGSGEKDGVSVVYCVLAFDDPRANNHFEVEMVYYMRSSANSDTYVEMMKEVIQSFGQIR